MKELKKFKSMQKEKYQLCALFQELMSFRAPSPSYPVFLYEQLTFFKLKYLKEGRPFRLTPSAQFLETFMESSFTEQNLLCEFYLHEMACPLYLHSNPYSLPRRCLVEGLFLFCQQSCTLGKGLSENLSE